MRSRCEERLGPSSKFGLIFGDDRKWPTKPLLQISIKGPYPEKVSTFLPLLSIQKNFGQEKWKVGHDWRTEMKIAFKKGYRGNFFMSFIKIPWKSLKHLWGTQFTHTGNGAIFMIFLPNQIRKNLIHHF